MESLFHLSQTVPTDRREVDRCIGSAYPAPIHASKLLIHDISDPPKNAMRFAALMMISHPYKNPRYIASQKDQESKYALFIVGQINVIPYISPLLSLVSAAPTACP